MVTTEQAHKILLRRKRDALQLLLATRRYAEQNVEQAIEEIQALRRGMYKLGISEDD